MDALNVAVSRKRKKVAGMEKAKKCLYVDDGKRWSNDMSIAEELVWRWVGRYPDRESNGLQASGAAGMRDINITTRAGTRYIKKTPEF